MKTLITALALAGFVALVSISFSREEAAAAPSLELPWPKGLEHNINAGNTYGCPTTHSNTTRNYYAIDFVFAIGDQVTATAAGTIYAGQNGWPNAQGSDDRGNFIEIDHGNGYHTRYLHLRVDDPWAPGIQTGVSVAQGQFIGRSGDTGYVPAHLHFDMQYYDQNGSHAYKAEPMSGVSGFGWYGFSKESGIGDAGCVDPGGNIHDPSPPFTSTTPCITPLAPYADDSLYREENGNGQVFVVRGQTKYYIPNPQTFEAMEFEWNAIQCVAYGSLTAISDIPYDKTLFQEWSAQGGEPIYLADCQAKFWVPNMDVFNDMVNNGWANYPPYVIPPGDAAYISDVPMNGCRMQEYGGATLWLTCPNPSRKWGMTAYAWSIFGAIDSNVRIVWPGALNSMTTLDQTALKSCPDGDGDGWSDLSEQYMGTDLGHRCAATGITNDEPLPDRWPKDFNDSQDVSITDISTFSSRFNKPAPGPPYAPRWDLNTDDQITILDLAGFVLGETCTP